MLSVLESLCSLAFLGGGESKPHLKFLPNVWDSPYSASPWIFSAIFNSNLRAVILAVRIKHLDDELLKRYEENPMMDDLSMVRSFQLLY